MSVDLFNHLRHTFGVGFSLPERWQLEWHSLESDRFWTHFRDQTGVAFLAWNSRRPDPAYESLQSYIDTRWVEEEIVRYTEGFKYRIVSTSLVSFETAVGEAIEGTNYELAVDIAGDEGHNMLFFRLTEPSGGWWHWGIVMNQGLAPKAPLEASLTTILNHITIT